MLSVLTFFTDRGKMVIGVITRNICPLTLGYAIGCPDCHDSNAISLLLRKLPVIQSPFIIRTGWSCAIPDKCSFLVKIIVPNPDVRNWGWHIHNKLVIFFWLNVDKISLLLMTIRSRLIPCPLLGVEKIAKTSKKSPFCATRAYRAWKQSDDTGRVSNTITLPK